MEINPFDFFTDTHGDALDDGSVWIGQPNLDPRQYPAIAFYDKESVIPAPMPIRTSNGYIVRNGSPTFLYINGNYSVLVQDKDGRQVYYVPDFLMIGNSSAVSPVTLYSTVSRTVDSIADMKSLDSSVYKFALCLGYYERDTKGGGNFYLDETDSTSPDNGGTVIVGNDGGRWKRPPKSVFYADEFGAKGDDLFDNAAAFANCRAAISSGRMEIGAGIYRTSASITIGGSGFILTGQGRNATTVKNTTTGIPTVVVTTGSNNITVQDLTLDRVSLGTFGGDGIAFAKGGVADGFIYRIYSKNNYNGIAVGGTGYSIMADCFCERNAANGLDITNSNVFTTCQWYISDTLCQLNGNDGIRLQSVATIPIGGHMSLGELRGCRTFANSGRGLIAIATPQVGIYSIRAKGCFFGEDGLDEVYLDTYGNLHTFDDCFIELGGTSLTGPAYSTPATFNSNGFYITANTPDCTINGGKINGQSLSGVYSLITTAGKLRINNTTIANNGTPPSVDPATHSGILNAGAGMQCVGVQAYGQQHGSFNAGTGGDSFIGCDFRLNVNSFSGNTAGNVSVGNRP